ncbi:MULTISPECIES: DUF6069 family protein [Rhodococcus]|uniref:DUF6069 family protein n=1 Tax=Rhodococcus TaxID=1827 RepID=UPI00211C0CC5|nr:MULTISPECIES: DUF6069 family protein [Rhodococcus]MCZ4556146.1 DUF6069 family protein [Rhodococcus maanshanensis]
MNNSVLAATAAAVVGNLAIYLVAVIAGGSLEVLDKGTVNPIPSGSIVMISAVPTAIGMGPVALLSLRWPAVVRLGQVVGAALPLLTIALAAMADTDGVTKTALILMHVLMAAVIVASLELLHRRVVGRANG